MRRLLVVALFLLFAMPAAAAESPYQTNGLWDCGSPCTITYSIDAAYPARSAALVREVYRDISVAPEIEFVEGNGNAKVKWETCETTRTGLCGFWTRYTFNKGQGGDFASFRKIEVVIDTTTWDQLADLKSYMCHEALHTVGFEHAPRYLPSCFNGTSPTWQPGVEDYTLIQMTYGV
jgi:hypothetical protein